MEQQLCALAGSREVNLAYLIHSGFNSLPVHSREVRKGRVPRREKTKNQPLVQLPQCCSQAVKGMGEGLATPAVPYLSSPVDGSRSRLCMISSSERKDDGCPGERVKDTLLSEVHLSQEREQPKRWSQRINRHREQKRDLDRR